ncbi:hypothetical protein CMV14_05225 [Rhizorhabdus dicambivorans]|nr:hypothetical protein CMV14_05225 [Rhizorhabdus dicambivorans]
MIIGCDRTSIDTLQDKLWNAGYRSIIVARDTGEAALVASCCPPSLIVLIPDSTLTQTTDVLRDLSERAGAPIIVATADPAAALRCLGPAVTLEGPYATDEIAQAEVAARRPAPALAHAA